MIRSVITGICLLVASQAQAFSGSFTSGLAHNEIQDKTSYNLGLVMSQPLFLGLAWWSWTGAGMVQELDKDPERWAQSLHGLDFTIGRITLTGTAKALVDIEAKELSSEYGARIKVKLW